MEATHGPEVRGTGRVPVLQLALAVVSGGRRHWEHMSPVLTRAPWRQWAVMQDELRALSSNHLHFVALRSGLRAGIRRAANRRRARGAGGRPGSPVIARDFRRVDLCSAAQMSALAARKTLPQLLRLHRGRTPRGSQAPRRTRRRCARGSASETREPTRERPADNVDALLLARVRAGRRGSCDAEPAGPET